MPSLFFRERGNGPAVVLLHGFPFHQGIWDGFADKLAEDFRVYSVDLPGFGRSPMLPEPFSIDDAGECVLSWMKEIKLDRIVLVGHSLGGYVALSIAMQQPSLISGLVLFHSTALPDAGEKRQSRDKVLEFISSRGVLAFTSNFIAPLFADPGHPATEKVRAIATSASAPAVTGYTRAMRDRKDRTHVLKEYPGHILFLTGEKDQGISVASIQKQALQCRHPDVQILADVAHMGMFENEKKCLEKIRAFIEKLELPKP